MSIYRGLPGSGTDPTGYGATRRQVARWRSNRTGTDPRLDIHLRPLDYSLGKPREKGIDVQLALDLAFGAANGEFDVVVLFSGDSDLLPALERASASGVACESASWRDGGRRLPKKPFLMWEHRLTELDYRHVDDPTDYR
ncbi:NYN domain-containing protein [Candidatus Poriferisodalis sp.]|uniref:NYN domain-containing protein n=1 Tax=Candidatus Poriferisodalis sp. TaxID=3101277 RepID=UPI003D13307E